MNKPKFETPDMVEKNIEKLAEIFPNCITEARDENGKLKKAVNFEMLQQILSTEFPPEGSPERYEFTWVGKRAAIAEANKPIRKTLRPCKAESKNWDTTENLYIEGDNLEVLKLLQESYLGKVKMIYIDPPYNTGNDFIYRDDFKQTQQEYDEQAGLFDEDENRLFKNTETNGRFHSDWCSMMYSRLMLAKNFLSDDGVIFISIDDHEYDNLKKICDEIFNQNNFIGTLAVEINPKGRKNSKFISISSEYCIIYAKNKKFSYFIENIPKNAADMKEDEYGNLVHNSGKRVLVGENSFNSIVIDETSDKNYSVYYRKKDNQIEIRKEKINQSNQTLIKEGFKKYYSYFNNELRENTYTKNKFLELFKNNALEFTNTKIYEKNFSEKIRIKSLIVNKNYMAIINGRKQEYSIQLTTTGAGTYLKELFYVNDSPFNASKNLNFIKLLISLIDSKDFVVMDFFSGSATTADAVMSLNKDDDGKRKFILIQLDENIDENLKKCVSNIEKKNILSALTICNNINKKHFITEIGKERIRRAGEKIKADHPLTTQDLDIGFRVFKVDSSNMNDVYYSAGEYSQDMLVNLEDNIKPDRTDLDLLFGCLLDWGLPISLPYTSEQIENCTVHTYNDGDLVACFDENIPESVIKEIAKRKPLRAVFRDAGFGSSPEKINVTEIFKMLAPDTDVKVI